MFDFSASIDLPLFWSILIAFTVFLYVFLDGFDLGVGILFPFASSDQCRDKMMNSITPFWDGNETWLVLGGGSLFAAFPLAYSIIIPAVYMPITIMLIALVFRGISFEFRFKSGARLRRFWDYAFHFGSLIAAFMQGVILGTFIEGIKVSNFSVCDSNHGWLTPFSVFVGIGIIFGYALLGATWVILKTNTETQEWARKSALYSLIYVVGFMGLFSIWTPFIHEQIIERWFSIPNFFYLLPIPIITIFSALYLLRCIIFRYELAPFLLSIWLFALGYLGIAISLWPWVVPYEISIWDAAAAPESLSLLLVGTLTILPIVLSYTAYTYYIFRGKTTHESLY